jgi:hypothetical protein
MLLSAALNRPSMSTTDAAARAKSLSGLLAGAKQAKKNTSKFQPQDDGKEQAAARIEDREQDEREEQHAATRAQANCSEQPRRQHTVAGRPPQAPIAHEDAPDTAAAATRAPEEQPIDEQEEDTDQFGGAAALAGTGAGESEAPSGAGRGAESSEPSDCTHHASSDASRAAPVRGPSAGRGSAAASASQTNSPRVTTAVQEADSARGKKRDSSEREAEARGVPDFVDEARGGLHRPKSKKAKTAPLETHSAPVMHRQLLFQVCCTQRLDLHHTDTFTCDETKMLDLM